MYYHPVMFKFGFADLGVYFNHRTQVGGLSTETFLQTQTLKFSL